MADLQPYKNQIASLSYEDKMVLCEWLHTQIDLDRGKYVQEKGVELNSQIDGFMKKGLDFLHGTGKALKESIDHVADSNAPDKK